MNTKEMRQILGLTDLEKATKIQHAISETLGRYEKDPPASLIDFNAIMDKIRTLESELYLTLPA